MGVNSLWDIVGPTARPVRLEALTRKKLAVDASIWIYQFLKAVRDSEGNALHQSHIVGFFRRICKLLYFGIQPVFVFDGGAPALKRETIRKRRERREGTQESVMETAQRLLAINVQRQAHDKKRKAEEETVYFDDLPTHHPNEPQRVQRSGPGATKKRFVPKDEYHLPELGKIRVHEDDERLMPEEEFQEMTKGSFDVVDGININDVDPNSPEFSLLPMPTQYMILSHLRLKSRLRMGYSKDQLEEVFDNSMDFSRFQIQQVKKRNFYTQRLMDISGMGEDGNATRRIAGEKDRKYALLRTDDGWSLSLDKEEEEEPKKEVVDVGTYSKPLFNREYEVFEVPDEDEDMKSKAPGKVVEVADESSDDEFEEVPLEKEEPEDVEYNKAVIESIYEKFNGATEDVKPNKATMSTVSGFSENELREAIQRSKADLSDMYKKEERMEKGEGLLDLKLDDSLLFGGEKGDVIESPEATRVPEVQKEKEKKIETVIIEDDEKKENKESISIEDEKEENKESILIEDEDEEAAPEKATESVVEAKTEAKAETKPSAAKPTRKSEVEKIQEVEDLIKEHNKDEEVEEAKKYTNDVPEWFGGNIGSSKNVYYDNFNTGQDHEERDRDEDEEAGLIPWDEAKRFIEARSESDTEDVVEVAAKEKEAEEVAPAEPATSGSEEKEANDAPEAPAATETQAAAEEKKEQVKELVLDYEFVEGEEELAKQQTLAEEKDHEKLKQDMIQDYQPSSHSTITEEQMLQERLHKQKRDAEEVTQTMINDIKELLRRFGIPFITAPMEAEAQCVELLKLKLVDGIVTDDSDSFLFGGDRVYKNMFNQKQYVECYLKDDLEHKLGLDQKRLIELGLLLGSDYTDGIKGVGPVLAMEILAEFGSLSKFKQWFDKSVSGKADSDTSLKRNLLQRVKNGKLYLSSSFPDPVVFDAYMEPEVDHSDEPIKWGVPNLDQIRSFLMYNVGWSQARVDEVMVPLIRDMNRKLREGTQSTIGEFFNSSHLQSSRELKIGKRMKAAANKLRK